MHRIVTKSALLGASIHQLYHTKKALDITQANNHSVGTAISEFRKEHPNQKIMGYNGGKYPIIPSGRHGNFYLTDTAPLALLYAQQERHGAVAIVSVPKTTELKIIDIPPSPFAEGNTFTAPNMGDADCCKYGASSIFIPGNKIDRLPLETQSIPITAIDPQALLYRAANFVLSTFV